METRFRSICTIRFKFCKTAHNIPLRVSSEFTSSGMWFYVTGGSRKPGMNSSTFDDKGTIPDDSVTSQHTRARKTLHISDTPNTCVYLLTYLLTPWCSPSWKANWFAASQEIPRISRNPKVHYRTHKRPPPGSNLCQPNPVHIPTSHLL